MLKNPYSPSVLLTPTFGPSLIYHIIISRMYVLIAWTWRWVCLLWESNDLCSINALLTWYLLFYILCLLENSNFHSNSICYYIRSNWSIDTIQLFYYCRQYIYVHYSWYLVRLLAQHKPLQNFAEFRIVLFIL